MTQTSRRSSRAAWWLLAIVTLMSVAANLPDPYVKQLGIDRDWLLGALVVVVAIALLRYLKFVAFLAVSVLVVGANLPADLARELGVDQGILLIVLLFLVAISFANYVWKLLPTGVEPQAKTSGEDAAAALSKAVGRGEMSLVRRLLDMGVDPNATVEGRTPLMVAAEHGYTDMVQLLLERGADANAKNEAGQTAGEIALDHGFTRAAAVLRQAELATQRPDTGPSR